MSRGDRSRPERTTEERERDREERERRRAERNPRAEPTPAEPAPTPAEPAPTPGEPAPTPGEPAPTPGEPAPTPAEGPAAPGSGDRAVQEPIASEPYEPPPTEAFEVLAPAAEPPIAGSSDQQEPRPAPLEAHAEPDPGVPEPAEPKYEAPEDEAPEDASHEDELHEDEPPAASSRHRRIGTPPPPISPSRRRSRPARASRAGASAAEGRRSHTPRLAALIALFAAAVAVIVAIVSLSSGSQPKAPPLPAVVRVLIPEGETRVQIADIAKAKGLTGSYRRVSEHSPLLDPTKYGAPKGTPDLEGFLFPATYELDKGAPALRLVEDQLAAFTEHFGPPEIARAKALHVTPYQLLTVASMVEREAQVPGDRAKIAAVIYNRLAQGIPLGIDASIYYAVELEKNIATYTHELTEAQLHINSPYNTRTHTGLPPTPISNPGAASIEAAAHPAKVSYLYYVAGADGCGEQVFSNTQAQFEADVAAYRSALEKNGGHPPACTKK